MNLGVDGSLEVERVLSDFVTVRGEVDLANAGTFGGWLFDALQLTTGHVVIDMSGVTFIDAAGVQELQRVVDVCGGKDITIRPSGQVFSVLEILRLTDAWTHALVLAPGPDHIQTVPL